VLGGGFIHGATAKSAAAKAAMRQPPLVEALRG
jgi:hypothetical protein